MNFRRVYSQYLMHTLDLAQINYANVNDISQRLFKSSDEFRILKMTLIDKK